MPTYIYETISDTPDHTPQRFEVFQRMSDMPLEKHPETGEPIRRVITAGGGIMLTGLKRSTSVNKRSPAATACGCATAALRADRQVQIKRPDGCGHGHWHGHEHGHGHKH